MLYRKGFFSCFWERGRHQFYIFHGNSWFIDRKQQYIHDKTPAYFQQASGSFLIIPRFSNVQKIGCSKFAFFSA